MEPFRKRIRNQHIHVDSSHRPALHLASLATAAAAAAAAAPTACTHQEGAGEGGAKDLLEAGLEIATATTRRALQGRGRAEHDRAGRGQESGRRDGVWCLWALREGIDQWSDTTCTRALCLRSSYTEKWTLGKQRAIRSTARFTFSVSVFRGQGRDVGGGGGGGGGKLVREAVERRGEGIPTPLCVL